MKAPCVSPEQDAEVRPGLWGEGSCVLITLCRITDSQGNVLEVAEGGCEPALLPLTLILLLVPQTCVKFSVLFLLRFSASWNTAPLLCLCGSTFHSSLPEQPQGSSSVLCLLAAQLILQISELPPESTQPAILNKYTGEGIPPVLLLYVKT